MICQLFGNSIGVLTPNNLTPVLRFGSIRHDVIPPSDSVHSPARNRADHAVFVWVYTIGPAILPNTPLRFHAGGVLRAYLLLFTLK